MADFSQNKKYNYNWQSSKFKNLALSGSYISQFINDVGYITSSNAASASYAISSSYAATASYLLGSITSASYARTASYVNPLNQNVIITGSVYIPDNNHSIYFSGSGAASRLVWNNTDGTLDLGLKGGNVTLQVGQENVIRVVNKTGADLLEADFKVVRVRSVAEGGAQGQRLAVVLAQADSDADSATTLGIVTENISNNQEGFITIFGTVRGIDTTGAKSYGGLETWVDGDMLYLSPNYPGYLTNVKPQAPQHLVIIGYIEYAHANNGKIFVKIDNGWEIGELHDVRDTTTTSSYGDLLVKSGSVWTNSKQLTGSYGLTGSLTATSFTGSLLGTASYASQALSASYAPTIIPSGPFGIANSSGSYTYYTTFSSSMAAAASGQTVEMFADVTETGSVTITLKNGVNVNGNGHTYTLNNSGLIHALSAANSVTTSCNILNLNVIRTGSTGSILDNSAFNLGINGTGTINCAGSTFRNNGSGCGIVFNTNSLHSVNYATAYATTIYGAIGIFTSAGGKLNNSMGYGTSGGTGIRCHSGGDIQNCIGYSDSGYGIYGMYGIHVNCTGISTSGNGFFSSNISSNCIGRSTSGTGFESINTNNLFYCMGISISGVGFTSSHGSSNCTGTSSSGVAFRVQYVPHYNIMAKSTSNYALWNTNGNSKLYNGIIISEWNNAAGYGIRGNGGAISDTIVNCIIRLSNSSAPYLFNDGIAQAITMRGNTYQGGAVFNANLTQATVSTQDNQGNIYL